MGGGNRRIPTSELRQGEAFANLEFESRPVQIFPELPISESAPLLNGTEILLKNESGKIIGAIDPGYGIIVQVIKTDDFLYVVYTQRIVQVNLRDTREMRIIFSTVVRITLVKHSPAISSLFILDIEDTLRVVDLNDEKSQTTIAGIVNFCLHPTGPWMCACLAEDASVVIYFLTALNKVKGVNQVTGVEGYWDVYVQEMVWVGEAIYYRLSNQTIFSIPFDEASVLQAVGQVRPSRIGRPRLDENVPPKIKPKNIDREEIKRPRGRPRKYPPKPVQEESVKRPKGRPRKNPIDDSSTTREIVQANLVVEQAVESGRPKRAAARNKSYKEPAIEDYLKNEEDEVFTSNEDNEEDISDDTDEPDESE